MGEVYLAEDPSLQRNVALKILSRTDAKAKRRFIQEAITASKLSHPNVAVVHEAGETDDGMAFIAMQYVEGETLRERLRRGSLSIPEIVRIAGEVADALDDAHRHGIVHRDIKPGNIMIDSRGHAKVLDFGIAKLLELDGLVTPEASTAVAETTAGKFVGTLQYVSPEQAGGGAIDARSDIFSFGVVLYEMLTGTNPFAALTFLDTVRRVREVTPNPITRSDCPAELKRIVFKCLEKDRERRYQSARDVVLDLERIAAPPRRDTRWIVPAAMYGALVILAISGSIWYASRGMQPTPVMRAAGINSIAVLPFVNFSPARENEFIGDGISEEVINALGQVGNLKVVSRTSSFTLKGTHADAKEIGKTLGVDALVEGSVQRAGDRLRVTVQLVSTHDGFHLWSQTYNGAAADVFSIEDQIARSIAAALRRQLAARSLAGPATRDVRAYDLYVKARHEESIWTRGNFDNAVADFRAAIERDPSFADAYAGLAETYSLMDHLPGLTSLPPSETYRLAVESANKALSIAPQSAEAHAALGHIEIHLGHFAEARQELSRALEINPNLSYAYIWSGVLARVFGDREGMKRQCARAREVDPESSLVLRSCAINMWANGDFDDAVEYAGRGIEVDPEYDEHYLIRANSLTLLGRFSDAEQVLDRVARVRPGAAVDIARGLLLAVSGHRSEAVALLRRIEAKESGIPPILMMRAWAAAGDLERSMKWLDRAVTSTRDYARIGIDTPPHPSFQGLRSHPHYAEVRRELGLPPVTDTAGASRAAH